MAARRLLIVMLILLGLSTLAAALVPQHSLRGGSTTGSTAQRTQSTTTTPTPSGRSLTAKILVGAKQIPVVASPVCAKREPRCEPIHVGDQLSLKVLSTKPSELEIPALGLFGVASPEAPALFELLPTEPGTIGILFTTPRRVAARIEVLSAAAAAKAVAPRGKTKKAPKSRARAG